MEKTEHYGAATCVENNAQRIVNGLQLRHAQGGSMKASDDR